MLKKLGSIKQIYVCPVLICSRYFPSKSTFMEHARKHILATEPHLKSYSCSQCSISSSKLGNIKQHVVNRHHITKAEAIQVINFDAQKEEELVEKVKKLLKLPVS